MTKYEYGHIQRLATSLSAAGIDPEIATRVLAGGESIGKNAPPEKKSEWLRGAMSTMDQLIDLPTRINVRERSACCLGGKRDQIARAIARDNESLADRVRAANDAKLVFGHAVSLTDDDRVLVEFSPRGLAEYTCPCQPKARGPMSITFCYCCGGHVRHHLQTALGRQVEVTVLSSALSSGGSLPCNFGAKLLD